MRAIGFAVFVGGLIAAAPMCAAAGDETITASFSLAIPPSTVPNNEDTPSFASFYSTSFPLFSPTHGSLDGVSVSLSGSVSWASIAEEPNLFLFLAISDPEDAIYENSFFPESLGKFALNVSATASDLTDFVGTGNGKLFLGATTPDPTNTNIIGSDGLTGTVTYTYAPALTSTLSVPETSTWALMLLGFGGLGYAAFRRGKTSAAPL